MEQEETVFARHGICKHGPSATNTYATVEELFEAEFSMRFVSYQIMNTQRKESRRLVLLRTSSIYLCQLSSSLKNRRVSG
jgi:hypothetical protein